MEWTNKTVMKFLELYQKQPCIWDPQNRSYKNKNRLVVAWNYIKDNLGEPCTIDELKKKKESLMAAYRGYRTKIKKSEMPSGGQCPLYKPTWFAYSLMDSFLGKIYKCPIMANKTFTEFQWRRQPQHRQDDIDEVNIIVESDDSIQELIYSSQSSLQRVPANHGTLSSQQSSSSSSSTPRRKQHNAPEQRTMNNINQAQNPVRRHRGVEDDECSIFGKLIAKKMRKLTEERRDLMMVKINQLFYSEFHEQPRPNSSEMTLHTDMASLSRIAGHNSS